MGAKGPHAQPRAATRARRAWGTRPSPQRARRYAGLATVRLRLKTHPGIRSRRLRARRRGVADKGGVANETPRGSRRPPPTKPSDPCAPCALAASQPVARNPSLVARCPSLVARCPCPPSGPTDAYSELQNSPAALDPQDSCYPLLPRGYAAATPRLSAGPTCSRPRNGSGNERPVEPKCEPGAGNPLAGFCPEGGPKGPSAPKQLFRDAALRRCPADAHRT